MHNHRLASVIKEANDFYQDALDEYNTLARCDVTGPILEKAAKHLEEISEQVIDGLRRGLSPTPNRGYRVVAASPAFGGPMTRAYRICLIQENLQGQYVVCSIFLDDGSRGSGNYFGPGDIKNAMLRWAEQCQYEIQQRDARCYCTDKSLFL